MSSPTGCGIHLIAASVPLHLCGARRLLLPLGPTAATWNVVSQSHVMPGNRWRTAVKCERKRACLKQRETLHSLSLFLSRRRLLQTLDNKVYRQHEAVPNVDGDRHNMQQACAFGLRMLVLSHMFSDCGTMKSAGKLWLGTASLDSMPIAQHRSKDCPPAL